MDDKDLSALIRMATEAEALEEPAPIRFEWAKANRDARQGQVRKMVAGIATLAAAAGLGFAALVWMNPAKPSQPIAVTPPAINPQPVDKAAPVLAAKKPEIGSVIMAVFRDEDDRCSCIQINEADFKGKLSEIGGSEILRRALADPCHENPMQVMVIAMQGPKDSLPSSQAEAELLAAAVREDSSHCGGDSMCISSRTSPFFADDVTVVTSTLNF